MAREETIRIVIDKRKAATSLNDLNNLVGKIKEEA